MEDPDAVGPPDVEAVLAEGVPPDGVDDAIHVTFLFDVVNHVADALGFDLLDEEGYARGAKSLLRFGYKLPGPLARQARRNPAW